MIGKPMFMSPSATAGEGTIQEDSKATFSFAIDGDEPITGYTIHIEDQNPPILSSNDIKAMKDAASALTAFAPQYSKMTTSRTGNVVTISLPVTIAKETTFQLGKYITSKDAQGNEIIPFNPASWSGNSTANIEIRLSGLKYMIGAEEAKKPGKYLALSPTGSFDKYGYDLPLTYAAQVTIEASEEKPSTAQITFAANTELTFSAEINLEELVDFRSYRKKGGYRATIFNKWDNGYLYGATKSKANIANIIYKNTSKGKSPYITTSSAITYASKFGSSSYGDYMLYILNSNYNSGNFNFDLKTDVGIPFVDTSAADALTEVIKLKTPTDLKDTNGDIKFLASEIDISKLTKTNYRWYIDSILDKDGNDTGIVSKNETFNVRPAHKISFTIGENNTITHTGNLFEIRDVFIQNLNGRRWKFKMEGTSIQIPYCGTERERVYCRAIFKDGLEFFKKAYNKDKTTDSFTSLEKNIAATAANHLYAAITTTNKKSYNLKSFDDESFGVFLPQKAEYDYTYFPSRKNNYSNEVEDYDDFYGYSLLLATKEDEGFKVEKAYDFELNVSISSYNNNKQYSTLKNFTSYPMIERNFSDYLSGTCKSLVGKMGSKLDNYWQYIQTPEIVDELAADLIDPSYVKLLKMPEGRMLIIEPSSGLSVSYNDTHSFKEISFNWTEIGDATYAAVYGEKEVTAANGD